MNPDFEAAALEAGFTQSQVDFLDEWLAKYPHSHDVSEINGLDEMLEGDDEEDDDE